MLETQDLNMIPMDDEIWVRDEQGHFVKVEVNDDVEDDPKNAE